MADPYQFQCCFCGNALIAREVEVVTLVIPLHEGGAQELRSHLTCLRRSLHPSVPLAVLDDASQDDDYDSSK